MKRVRFLIWSFLFVCCFLGLWGCSDEDEKKTEPTQLELSIARIEIGNGVGEESLTLTANETWTVQEVPSWLTVTPDKGGAGENIVKITWLANNEGNDRQVDLHFVAGSLHKILTVVQKEHPALLVEQKAYFMTYEVGVLSVGLKTNTRVSCFLLGEPAWIRVVGSKALTEQTVLLSVQENTTDEVRIAKLVVKDAEDILADTVVITQNVNPKVVLEKNSFMLKYDETELTVSLSSNIELETVIPEGTDWIRRVETKAMTERKLVFRLDRNETEKVRSVEIGLKMGETMLPYKITVNQMHVTEDGMVVTLQKATSGIGIDIIIMGDGYTKEDIGQGMYDHYLDEAYQAFFDIEPYRTYRNYFNVYGVYAYSAESGISDSKGFTVDTKFSVAHAGYAVNMTCEPEACFAYAEKAPVVGDRNSYLVILFANYPTYGGTCYLFQQGAAIAICPTSQEASPQDFYHIVQHEAGGHGFGKQADEYVTAASRMPEWQVNTLNVWHEHNIYMNTWMSDDPAQVPWKDFIGHPLYPEVGLYEGGYYYRYGVWRPVKNTIMNGDMNYDYYSAPARRTIVERIRQFNYYPITFEEFVDQDAKGREEQAQRNGVSLLSVRKVAKPLPPPILIAE